MKITNLLNIIKVIRTIAYINLVGAITLFIGLAGAQWCAGYDSMMFDATFFRTLVCVVPMVANSIVLFVTTSIAQGRFDTDRKIRIMRKQTNEELLRRSSMYNEE